MIIAIATNNVATFSEVPSRAQNAAYCKYVSDAGYSPILIPMEADPVEIADTADGLILPGGIDIDPINYGISNSYSYHVDPERDAAERALFHTFREFGKPVFGICRGFQMIFRELLDTHADKDKYKLYFEYLENIHNHNQSTGVLVPRRFPYHMVRANVTSLFSKGEDENLLLVPVNSMHHQAVVYNFAQAVENLAPDYKKLPDFTMEEPYLLDVADVEICAWSMRGIKQPSIDKKRPDYSNYWTVLEAAKIHNWGGPIMGVQWHPEELGDIRILRNFFGGTDTEITTTGTV